MIKFRFWFELLKWCITTTFTLLGDIPIMRVVEKLHWKGAYVLNLAMEFI